MEKKRVILHMDADSFFANCEMSRNPKYKGKPVVVGGVDRGIAVAINAKGKKRGIYRGMNSRDIRSVCPDAVVLPVDFRLYGLYSDFMFSIFKEYIPDLQKYSIDECFGFVDVDNLLQAKEIAYKIKDDIQKKLDITVSVGVSTTKVLAKIASSHNKPNGVCVLDPISSSTQNIFKDMPVGKVWGIGGQTAISLNKKSIYTVDDFLKISPNYIQTNFNKNLREIWNELSGVPVKSFQEKSDQKSIQKTRTFRPQTSNRSTILAYLSQNIENAFWKARRMNMAPREVHFFLKTSEFRYKRKTISFGKGVVNQSVILHEAKKMCEAMIGEGVLYRATGVTLSNLYPVNIQYDLFGEHDSNSRLLSMYKAIDDLSLKYGKNMLKHGTSSLVPAKPRVKQTFAQMYLDANLMRLGLPFLGQVV
jgi:DNA polymerase IV